MKYDLKTLSLVVILGSLFYSISTYTKSKLISNSPKKHAKEVILVNKTENSSKSIAPKIYIFDAGRNGLGISNNWKSR